VLITQPGSFCGVRQRCGWSFKIEVSRLEAVVFVGVEPDFEFAAKIAETLPL